MWMSDSELDNSNPWHDVEQITDEDVEQVHLPVHPLQPQVPVEFNLADQSYFEDDQHLLLQDQQVLPQLPLPDPPRAMPGQVTQDQELTTSLDIVIDELKELLKEDKAFTGGVRRSAERSVNAAHEILAELHAFNVKKVAKGETEAVKRQLMNEWVAQKATYSEKINDQVDTLENKIAAGQPAPAAAPNVERTRANAKLATFNTRKDNLTKLADNLANFINNRGQAEVTKSAFVYIQTSINDLKTGIEVDLSELAQEIQDPVSYTHLTLPTICSV